MRCMELINGVLHEINITLRCMELSINCAILAFLGQRSGETVTYVCSE